jgi:alpha-mannosidase
MPPPIREILVLHHSHFDFGYTHSPPVVRALHRRFLDQALNLADADAAMPEASRFRWTSEVTAPVRWWWETASPAQRQRWRAAAQRRQLSCGAFAFHGTPLMGADDLRRSLAGVAEARAEMGLPCRVAVQHDVNGVPWPAVGLLQEAGVELLLMGLNLTMGVMPFGRRHVLFLWEGPDGRRLPALSADHYNAFARIFRYETPAAGLDPAGWPAYAARLREWGWGHDWVFLTCSMARFPDNNPPDPHLAPAIRRWNETGRAPAIRLVTLEDLLARVQGLAPDSLPVHRGEWSDYWNFGSGSSAREGAAARRAKARLRTADLVGLRAGAPPGADSRGEALAALLAWDEHTWGSFNVMAGERLDTVLGMWIQKAAWAWTASSQAGQVLRDRLEVLAGNPPLAHGAEALLLVNPSPCPQVWSGRVWHRLHRGPYAHSCPRHSGLEAQHEGATTADSAWAGPVTLPPYGWRVVPWAELFHLPDPGPEVGEGFVATAELRLEFDPVSGRPTGLFDALRGWRVHSHGSETGSWTWLQPVCEEVDPARASLAGPRGGREAFFEMDHDKVHNNQSTWVAGWPARRSGAVARAGSVERTPGAATLVTRWELPGFARLETRLTLRAGEAGLAVELDVDIAEQSAPQGLYLALPLAFSAGWRAHADVAGLPYEIDTEQLPGVARDFHTVDSWVAVHDAEGCVQLCCPDAPLVGVGGFHFAKTLAAIPRPASPLLLAWPANNYWFTNFRTSQPGRVRLRWVVHVAAAYDPAECVRRGRAAWAPVEWHPVVSGAHPPAAAGRLLEIEGDLVVLAAEPAGGDGGAVVTLANPFQRTATATVRWPGHSWGAVALLDGLDGPWADPAVELKVGAGVATVTLPARRLARVRLASD